ncbi:MAG: phosphoglycerate dehydrogenase [Clostridia bacterium]|nr:phosphoglycerate dehydrogenase [Clostridia bacterium]
MYNIKLINKIAPVGVNVFDKNLYNVSEDIQNPCGYMVRSANLLDEVFPESLLAIARAGAGVNNIPVDRCAEQGIVVFNTPGANANGVKELAIAALMLASRDIVGGVQWAKSLEGDVAKAVEKGKGQFGGCEIAGKNLGVIGLGAIGGMVANTARHLGMNVIGCDPFLTVHGAWNLSSAVHHAQNYDEIYAQSDYITLHVPATADTKGMINRESIAKMRDGVRIINLARADLVNADDLAQALENGKVACYVTDFPTEQTLKMKNTICIPHLGASTAESEDNCAVMAARELVDYLQYGNINRSVNYPTVSIPYSGKSRICIAHRNIANMLSQITAIVSGEGLNIENLSNGSRGDYAYTIVEVDKDIPTRAEGDIEAIEGIIRVRIID